MRGPGEGRECSADTMSKPSKRQACDTYGTMIDGHGVHFTISRDGNDAVTEIAISTAGKVGQGIDQMMIDLGVAISRAIQRRDHETGQPIE